MSMFGKKFISFLTLFLVVGLTAETALAQYYSAGSRPSSYYSSGPKQSQPKESLIDQLMNTHKNGPFYPGSVASRPKTTNTNYYKPSGVPTNSNPYYKGNTQPGSNIGSQMGSNPYYKPATPTYGNGSQPPLDDCRYYKPCKTPAPVPPPTPKCQKPYPKDIDGHWAEIYVRRLIDLCVVEGYKDGLYHPEQHVTRGEMIKMALASAHIMPKQGCYDADCGSPYMDLEMWQGPWVRAAWDHHLLEDAQYLYPNEAISRQETVKIVLSAFGYQPVYVQESFFNDVHDENYKGWIEQAHLLGIVQGVGKGNFAPNLRVTRAEAAKIMAKTIEVYNTKIN
jgi:hypothetical protein